MRMARFALWFVLAAGILAIPAPSRAQVAVGVSIRIGPPALPVYAQPICPGPGYLWVPGYWAYGPEGYFWVPGTWALAPEPGLLWTPGYWGFGEGIYIWHAGYWGPRVGFYGGINYGFGYTGVGFVGGYWRAGSYYYNRSVTNVNVTVIHNTYNTTVVNNTTVNRVSFNGAGGISARPTREEAAAEHDRHVPMTGEQNRHFEAARGDRSFLASENHGRPEVAATARSGEFRGRGVERAREANMNRPPENHGDAGHADRSRDNNGRVRDDRPPSARSSRDTSYNSRSDEKHQRETDKMQRHDQERQSPSRQNPNQRRQDQIQRRQPQQTDQMNRRRDQQPQKLEQRQQRETQRQEGRPPR